MSKYAIEVIGLGKRYHRGSTGRIQNAGDIIRALRRPFTKQDEAQSGYFWALQDVSFALKQGDILGIVGANGAGKSTLLKILSRIVAPTQGKIIMNGRVGALLEVGTGFHDELSGRENVYLNGAILGLKRRDIARLFDEIVDFSGVETFIDTPIKHYSSGMRLRLGFAVAAHLNPEILIVDEVLAVGDDDFRRKSMGKMQDVANDGRTVLYVSHAMRTVQQLCTRAIYLQKGMLMMDGTPDEIINTYQKQTSVLNLSENASNILSIPRPNDVVYDMPRISQMVMLDDANQFTDNIRLGEPLRFLLTLQTSTYQDNLDVIIRIETTDSISVTTVRSSDYQQWYSISPDKSLRISCMIPHLFLEPGEYLITLIIRDKQRHIHDHLPRIYRFHVINTPYDIHSPPMAYMGVVTAHSQWEIGD